jgi:hypothetical protein
MYAFLHNNTVSIIDSYDVESQNVLSPHDKFIKYLKAQNKNIEFLSVTIDELKSNVNIVNGKYFISVPLMPNDTYGMCVKLVEKTTKIKSITECFRFYELFSLASNYENCDINILDTWTLIKITKLDPELCDIANVSLTFPDVSSVEQVEHYLKLYDFLQKDNKPERVKDLLWAIWRNEYI